MQRNMKYLYINTQTGTHKQNTPPLPLNCSTKWHHPIYLRLLVEIANAPKQDYMFTLHNFFKQQQKNYIAEILFSAHLFFFVVAR